MRQITAYEKELAYKEREEKLNSPILVSMPADNSSENKQWRESVENYLRTFDLVAIPASILRDQGKGL